MKLAVGAALAICCGGPQPPAKTIQLNAPGVDVDLTASLVPGYVTLVDYWSDTCAACKIIEGKLASAIAAEPRLVVRKVDIGDGLTPVARTHQVGALPRYELYDGRSTLRYVLVGSDCLTAVALAHQLATE